jgi:uncharacterized membrane protein (DUF2068 family)
MTTPLVATRCLRSALLGLLIAADVWPAVAGWLWPGGEGAWLPSWPRQVFGFRLALVAGIVIVVVLELLKLFPLAVTAAAVLVFAAKQQALRGPAYRVLSDIQGGLGGPARDTGRGFIHELRRLFSVQHGTLTKIGLVVAAYAALEGAEAVGLWLSKRWAEYLTFIATTLLLPLEIYELTHKLSPLKILALVINVAVVIYLLLAKRLFGLRGGAAAEAAERERDAGWPAIERATPGALPYTTAAGASA